MERAPAALLRAIGLPAGAGGRGPSDLAVLGGSVLLLLGGEDSAASLLTAVMAGRASTSESRVLVGTKKLPVHTREASRYLGYVPEDPGCPPEVTPRAHLSLVAASMGMGGKRADKAISELLDWCLLFEDKDTPWAALDPERKGSLALASALLDNPQVIVIAREIPASLLDRLQDLKSLGKAILMRSGSVSGIPPAADRIGICDGDGVAAVVRRSDLEAVCRRMGTIEVGFYPALPRETMEQLPGVSHLRSTGSGYVFGHRDTSSALVHLAGLARANARSIAGLRVLPPEPSALARQLGPATEDQRTLFAEGEGP